ncbi:MAG: bifunctional folylpolyglutamate synthase/dihydrofolate synthase [Thalassobaculaceae bacterium]
MTLETTIQRLELLHPKVIDLSLKRLEKLLIKLDNPEKKLPPIVHVAGTNGKGSTISILRSIQSAAGRSSHVYTSPHLVNLTERFLIADKEIKGSTLVKLLKQCEEINAESAITFFEIITAVGFLAFSKFEADLVLLEVGLGGRFDATNVINNPILSIITPISLDHQHYLGNTLPKIAFEKAGILKENKPAVIGKQYPEALEVIKLKAAETDSELFIFDRDWSISETKDSIKFEADGDTRYFEKPSLRGAHQVYNSGIAIAAAHYMSKLFPIQNSAIDKGLKTVKWSARLQKIKKGPLAEILPNQVELWLDGGHNHDASLAISETIYNWKRQDPSLTFHLIFGSLNNREIESLLVPFVGIIDLIQTVAIPKHESTASPENAANVALSLGFDAAPSNSLLSAIEAIISKSNGKRIILVYGSLYLAGSILEKNC